MPTMGAKLKCYDDRLEQLTKQNEEFSALIERLMFTIRKGKVMYDNRLGEMKERHEGQLRDVTNRWLNDKLELQAYNSELEEKLIYLGDKNRDLVKSMKRMENGGLKIFNDLETRNCELKDVKKERDSLKEHKQKLETVLKEQSEGAKNYRFILESEIDDLRGKLRSSEQKILELCPGMTMRETVTPAGGDSLESLARSQLLTDSNQRIGKFGVPNIKPPDLSCPHIGSTVRNCVEITTQPTTTASRYIPRGRELLVVFLSILFFLITLFSRCTSDCAYYREPYTPPVTVSAMPHLRQ